MCQVVEYVMESREYCFDSYEIHVYLDYDSDIEISGSRTYILGRHKTLVKRAKKVRAPKPKPVRKDSQRWRKRR